VSDGWYSFGHVAIAHQPLIMLEQWKASRHRLLWVAVINRNVRKRDVPVSDSKSKRLIHMYVLRTLIANKITNSKNQELGLSNAEMLFNFFQSVFVC